jgi:Tol biopolymer transport system component
VELWVVSPGEAAVRITTALVATGGGELCGVMQAFSPDGKRIAFLEDTAANGELRLVLATPDGSRRELVRPPAGRAVRAFNWSPDGTHLAYGVNLPAPLGTVGGGEWGVVDATTAANVSLGPSGAVKWSPDGTRFVHVQTRTSAGKTIEELHERAADGSGERIVASTSDEVDWAEWNPAGGSIAFATGRFVVGSPLRDAVFTVVPGSPVVTLPDVVAGDENRRPLLSWSPDGQWMVVVRADLAAGTQDLVLEKPDGSKQLPVADPASREVRTFGWSNDGRLAYVVSSFPPGSSVPPRGLAYAWTPAGSPVQATAQGVSVEQVEWTPRGDLTGIGSRGVFVEDLTYPLLAWTAGRGEAVVVVNDVFSFAAARSHREYFPCDQSISSVSTPSANERAVVATEM